MQKMPLPANNPTTPVAPSASLDVIAKYRAITGAMTAMPMMILPITERKPMFFRPYCIFFFVKGPWALRFLFGVSLGYNALYVFDDRLEGCPWPKIASDTLLLQHWLILIRDNSSTH